jgi:hypothetical protein
MTGTLYYRLKQVDIDGKSSYSQIISIQTKNNVLDDLITLYPVPAKDELTIKFSYPLQGNINIEVYNIVGKLCISKNIFATNGDGISFGVDSLKDGMYTLKIIDTITHKNNQLKFIKE